MAYGDFKDLTKRESSDKILHHKEFNCAKKSKYDWYQCGLASMVYEFSDKKASSSSIKKENISNKCPLNLATWELAEELHKPIIWKFNKRKVQSPFIDSIWGADLDMQSISKFGKGFRFLLCVIGIYSKYAWVIPLKDKKVTTITNAFQKILRESNCKSNKIWVDKGSKFYNRSMKSWLEEKMIWKCVQRIMKENLLLLKDSLESYRTKFISIWRQYQKTFILIN